MQACTDVNVQTKTKICAVDIKSETYYIRTTY